MNILGLPIEIQNQIISYLPKKDWSIVASVCRKWDFLILKERIHHLIRNLSVEEEVQELKKIYEELEQDTTKCRVKLQERGMHLAKIDNLAFLKFVEVYGISDVKKLEELYQKPVPLFQVVDHCTYPPMLEAIANVHIDQDGGDSILCLTEIQDLETRKKIARKAMGKAGETVLTHFLGSEEAYQELANQSKKA